MTPIPGLRRDVLFTCTADEEAGGTIGAKWVAEQRPEWVRGAGAVNECGGVSVTVAGRRLYPIQVAEKGFAAYRISVRGTWGHGSMPRDDNAAVMAAAVIARLAVPGPTRITPVMARFLELAAAALPPDAAALLRGARPATTCRAPRRPSRPPATRCTPGPSARSSATRSARTSSTPAIKYNVIPGDAMVEVDCRVLPGTTEPDDARRARRAARPGARGGLPRSS